MGNDILIWDKHRNKTFNHVLKNDQEYILTIIENKIAPDKYKNKYKNFIKFKGYIQKYTNEKIMKKTFYLLEKNIVIDFQLDPFIAIEFWQDYQIFYYGMISRLDRITRCYYFQ